MLSQVTSLFLLEFAVGTLLFMLFMPLKDLKNTFFALNGGICLSFMILFTLLAGLFSKEMLQSDPLDMGSLLTLHSVRWLIVASMIMLVVSYVIFLFKGYNLSRILLLGSAALGLSALFTRGMEGMFPGASLIIQISGGLSLVLGSLLLGVCYGTMILGHWYLVTPSLPFRYLVNSSWAFIFTTIARTLMIGLTLALFYWVLGSETKRIAENLLSFDELGLFFIMRIFWGILGPLVLSFMILETAKIRSNQAATGILYVACIFVFIGELCSDYIFQMGGFPS